MKKLLAKIRKILRDRRTRRFLTRFVSGVAALIVFVTTYALVLPAITMEKEANCGIEAHQHDDSCYTEELICDIPESDGHHHDESCYSTTSVLVCETEEHEHSAENGCYDDEGNLICEVMEHRHNEECYEEVRELTCQIPESEGHHHTEDCYEKVLTCGKEVHVHSTACYENDPVSESAIAASTSSAAASTTSVGSVSSAGMTLNFEGDIEKIIDADEPVDGDPVDNLGSDKTNGSSETNDTSEIASSSETNTEAASDTEVTYGRENAGTGRTETSNTALTNADNNATALTSSADTDQYIPQLDAVDFNTVLNNHTGIYYYRAADEDIVEDSSAIPAEDWNRIPNNIDRINDDMDDVELGNKDLLRVYLSYTIPAGSLNATNPVARYRLPSNLHLTDPQVKAINENVNGLAGQYVDMSTLEITDPDKYNAYLGVEAVEGTRRPDEAVEDYLAEQAWKAGKDAENATEYISAVVRVENVYDADGLYGEKDAYLGQDLIFTFAPYSIEKNQHEYDSTGKPTKAGEEIKGWFTFDLNMGQVDFEEPEITTSTVKESDTENAKGDNKDNQIGKDDPEDIKPDAGFGEDDNHQNEHSEDSHSVDNSAADHESVMDAESGKEAENASKSLVTIKRSERSAEIVFIEDGWDEKGNKINQISTTLTAVEKIMVEAQDDDTEENNTETAREDESTAITDNTTEKINNDETEKTASDDKEDTVDVSSGKKTLVDSEESDQIIMPAMSFTDSIKVSTGKPSGIDENAGGILADAAESLPEKAKVLVRVEADEGTFPAGTKMVLKAVTKEDMEALAETVANTVEKDSSDSVENSVPNTNTGDNKKNNVNRQNNNSNSSSNIKAFGFQAVDITFFDKDGNEIEPAKPVRVALTSKTVEQFRKEAENSPIADPVVVHVDNDGNAEQMELVVPEDVEPAKGKTEEELNETIAAEETSTAGDDADTADDSDVDTVKQSEKNENKEPQESSEDSSTETSVGDNISSAEDEMGAVEKGTDTEEQLNPDNDETESKGVTAGTGSTVEFEAESFSVYVIVYTVDFHWGVNGKTYDFSIPGGGFVSLGHLIEVLGINDPGINTENSSDSAENAENRGDFRNETDGNSVAEAAHDGGSDAYEEAIDLNKAEVSEATKQFVADVSNVEFSSPGLAWVGKVDAESTVGGLKEANGLKVKYSAELTEEQIAVINAQTVEAGDWALISVQPFKTEETLTVTMKTGEAFTIQVTDAQISTHVITADGEDYIITVIYGPEAEIPVDAVLEAEEIVEGSKEYEKYVYLTREALMNRGAHDGENTDASDSGSEDGQEEAVSDDNAESFGMDGSIAECTASEDSSFSFARFFDIRIMAGKEKIEPKAPVTVKITYADAVDVEEGEELLAVHFAEDGTELIPIRSDRESRELTFEQGSFSVTGTVVNAGQNAWPNNGSYVLFTQIGEQCYAINHDGELVPVTRNGNQLSFEDADVLFHGMDEYLWQYERTSRYVYGQGWVNEDRLFFNVGESQNWINPANETGIGNNRTLARTNNRIKVSNGNYYITVDGDNSHIAGLGNEDNAIPIYFANGFNNVNKAIVHFVDRDGNPISGVQYDKDNANVVASPDNDGTFAIRYNWNGATGVVDLSEDFSKTGYTYASTHLSGVQSGTTLRQDGLTIDAKLTERQNGYLYIGTDIGSNKDYLPYNDDSDREYWEGSDYIWDYSSQRRLDQTIRAAAISANARQDYATSTDKDIYVILDPAPNTLSGGGDDPTDIDADDPVFTKTLEDNGDGTYTLSLTIEGHANSINKSTNANVLFVVDTSSSMANAVGNSTRIDITREALKQLGGDLMAHNQKIANRVQVSMIAFDGGVYNRLGWTASRSEFETAVDTYITSYYLHRGTDWEDALKSALTQAGTADSDPTFVIFFTDGEPSQYSNYHGANTYTGDPVSKSYSYYFNSFLSRESCNDEARALVDSGYELYGVFAFNNSGHTYPNGEADEESDSALLHNLVKYGYNTEQDLGEDSSNQKFFPVNNQEDLEDAFEKILEMINISVGFDQVEVTDNITDLTQAGFATSFDSVNDFSYYRSGNGHGTESEPWEVWENAPQAIPNVQNNSVTWELKNPDNTPMVLEDGVSYKVSFVVWPKQADFDWVANLANGTKTWDDVVAAGLHFPDGDNPQIVRTQTGTDEEDNPIYSYSIATNKPSKNGNGEIINNGISYRKIRTELLNTLPAGAEYNTPVTTVDEQGNTVITTYTQDNGVITKTVETMKTTCFNPPEPMPLDDTKMKVKKEWEDSINLGHRADYVIFNLLVDGQPYMDRTAPGEEEKEYEIRVEEDSDWLNEVVIAPGVIRDGDVLEEGHSYTISEEYAAEGSDFYGFSFEFKSQTVRPMNIDGNLVYLIQIDDDNPAPSGAAIHAIAGRTYYEAAGDAGDAGQRYYEAEKDSTGLAALSGTNGKTSELDITKIIDKGNTNLTESDLDEETFTYRITLDIPAGSNIDGIMGYCYFEYPNGPNEPFKLFGYQPDNGTALASDIERFGSADNSKKIYRSWNTTNDRIKSQLMKTNGDGSITIKMDLTLTQKEVLRLTNLPSGTTYEIEEVYANYYKPASPSHSEEGQKPLDGEDERPYLAPNLAEQGYSVTQILEKNSNQTEEEKVTHTGTRVISGTISETNTRYYHQYTNELANVTLGELKVTKHLEGYEWSGEKYYFTLTAGTADFNDGKTPETGISPMPASNRIYLSDTSGTADKTYTFGKIRYTRPGTYQYTITETDADGNVLSGTTGANGIFYAPADTVTVTVGYDDDEHLAVKKIEGSNGNTIWSAAENSAVVTGTTTFTNSIPIPIKKMDIDKKTQLSNAVFELLCGHSKLYFDPSYTILTQAQVESIIDMAVNDDGAAAAMAAEGITSTFTIGEISLNGLSLNTTYTLREIQPPDGYIITTNEATFTLSRDDDGLNISVTGENASVDEDGITIIITNEPGAALPHTGGPGTGLICLAGFMLTILAGAGLLRRRFFR